MSFFLITLGVGEVMKGQALTPHPDSNISSGDTLIQLMTGGQNSWETAILLGCGTPKVQSEGQSHKMGPSLQRTPGKKTQE